MAGNFGLRYSAEPQKRHQDLSERDQRMMM